ncbi:hypothetical protein B0H19DRAFT_1249311 [Mycena capillaripes]|nr:hypothetical protein B0H19DRAFT_1249311 [Mycena capillaripes]
MNAKTALVDQILSDAAHARGMFDPVYRMHPITEYTPCIDGYAGKTENNSAGTSTCIPSHRTWSSGTYRTSVTISGDGPTRAKGRGDEGVFDLLKLLDSSLLKNPKEFSIETDLTAHYDGLRVPYGSSHNVVFHADKNLIVAVGSRPRWGLIFVDVADPANPKTIGCAGEGGYVHEYLPSYDCIIFSECSMTISAQCLTYYGPNAAYNGSDKTFTIYDITDPSSASIISATPYYGVSYSHQGWVVDEKDQTYVLMNDELDKGYKRGWASDQKTTTYIWDIKDLAHPVLTGYYKSPVVAIDHNLYVFNGLVYESNYKSGLRIVDASSIVEDPTGAGFSEIAFFDVHPEDDEMGGDANFGGAWSAYPYFESGFILMNTIERGLFG